MASDFSALHKILDDEIAKCKSPPTVFGIKQDFFNANVMVYFRGCVPFFIEAKPLGLTCSELYSEICRYFHWEKKIGYGMRGNAPTVLSLDDAKRKIGNIVDYSRDKKIDAYGLRTYQSRERWYIAVSLYDTQQGLTLQPIKLNTNLNEKKTKELCEGLRTYLDEKGLMVQQGSLKNTQKEEAASMDKTHAIEKNKPKCEFDPPPLTSSQLDRLLAKTGSDEQEWVKRLHLPKRGSLKHRRLMMDEDMGENPGTSRSWLG